MPDITLAVTRNGAQRRSNPRSRALGRSDRWTRAPAVAASVASRMGSFAVLSSPRVYPSFSVMSESANPPVVESLLRSLPAWFGIEEAIVEYVAAAARLPTHIARGAEGNPLGVLLVERHFAAAAEVHLMAVDPAHHRAGVGRALMSAAEDDLAANGVRLLEVKTLGPSRPDRNYARTRLFYEACGFEPLEELHGLWGDNPCLVMVKALPARAEASRFTGSVTSPRHPGPDDHP